MDSFRSLLRFPEVYSFVSPICMTAVSPAPDPAGAAKFEFTERSFSGPPGSFGCYTDLVVEDSAVTKFSCMRAPDMDSFVEGFTGLDVVVYVHGAFTHPKHVLWESHLLQSTVQAALNKRAPASDPRRVVVLPFMWPASSHNLLDLLGLVRTTTDTAPLFLKRYNTDHMTARSASPGLWRFLSGFLRRPVPVAPPPRHEFGFSYDVCEHHEVPRGPRSVTLVAHSLGNVVLLQHLCDDPQAPFPSGLQGVVMTASDVECDAAFGSVGSHPSPMQRLCAATKTVVVCHNKHDTALRIAPIVGRHRHGTRLGLWGPPAQATGIPPNLVAFDCSAPDMDALIHHNYHITKDYRWKLEQAFRGMLGPLFEEPDGTQVSPQPPHIRKVEGFTFSGETSIVPDVVARIIVQE